MSGQNEKEKKKSGKWKRGLLIALCIILVVQSDLYRSSPTGEKEVLCNDVRLGNICIRLMASILSGTVRPASLLGRSTVFRLFRFKHQGVMAI